MMLLIGGCAPTPIAPVHDPNWVRISGKEAGCVSYGPRRREKVDRNIKLEPEFEDSLLTQLDGRNRDAGRCWYETPSGALRLFLGDFCGFGESAHFEQQESVWKLVRTDEIFASCHPRK